ncbi:FAD-binding oxidoreductase [Aureimonas sp. ME7]|uniref:NAD(P)/FAD-dependent oxidoreductase n=1 Tax=Aureimonas sp. ME7 TaxID=2744252 RepID=UPI0015F4017B|nr:FAD-binding oxidoreductase [Aureimonas sp. ME7]
MNWPSSLWAETALPLSSTVAGLEGDHAADVVIVGAGYTGLCAALRVAERGLKPVVIDANAVGWGASGRNGGVVSTKFRVSLPGVARSHGVEMARRMYELGHDAVAEVERLVETHEIEAADFRLCGNLRCAHNEVAMRGIADEAEIMAKTFGDRSIRVLDREEVAAETGSRDFVGGTLGTHSGAIHPLNYARGLARALLRKGGAIFEETPALSIERTGAGIAVTTPKGRVSARHLILATNGYSDLTPATGPVRRAVIPFRSAMVATAPMGDNLFATVMTERRSYSETRRMMRWFRPFGSRMIFGGRGAFGKADSQPAFAALEKAMVQIFPQLEGTPITHRWSGLVAMTLDSLPQVGRVDERTAFAMGYNGTGIAMASLMGGRVADLALGDTPELALLAAPAPKNVPFYAIREPAVRAVAGWYQFLDAIGR